MLETLRVTSISPRVALAESASAGLKFISALKSKGIFNEVFMEKRPVRSAWYFSKKQIKYFIYLSIIRFAAQFQSISS